MFAVLLVSTDPSGELRQIKNLAGLPGPLGGRIGEKI